MKKYLIFTLLIVSPFMHVQAEKLPWYVGEGIYSLNQVSDYRADFHTNRKDRFTGLTVGSDLYQQKIEIVGDMIRDSRQLIQQLNQTERQKLASDLKVNTTNQQSLIEALVERKIHQRNLELIKSMDRRPLSKNLKSYEVANVTHSQALETVSSIKYSPAADDIGELKNFFDKSGALGFCFGRAHYQVNSALNRGLSNESVAKIFLVGKMMPLGIFPVNVWQFHVAAGIRGPEGKWLALDNHLPRYTKEIYSVENWYNYYRKYLGTVEDFDIKMTDGSYEKAKVKALFLFFTESDKIGPDSNAYNKEITWGFDTNKDLKIDESEVAYSHYFPILDKFLKDSFPSSCDPIRYKKRQDTLCTSNETKQAIQNRLKAIEPFRQLRMIDEENRKYPTGG